jgi:hypothetical protein
MAVHVWRRLAVPAAVAFVGCFLAEGAAFLRANAQTFDEAAHLAAGYSFLSRADFRLMPEQPALVRELAALPVYLWYRLPFRPDPDRWCARDAWTIGTDFLYGSAVPADYILTLARVPNLLLGAALVGLVGWWAYRLWGRAAALVGMALTALDPNLLAHSCLVTMDLGMALFALLTLYLLWEYLSSGAGRLLPGVGVALGLALVTKYSALFLAATVVLVSAVHVLGGGSAALPWDAADRRPARLARRLWRAALATALILGLAAVVILPFYAFTGFGAWCAGLQDLARHQEHGHPAFLLGHYSRAGWWYYFPVAFLVKTPAASLLLVGASLALYRLGKPLGRRGALFLLVPVAVFFAVAMRARINIGIRHLLVVYPFLYVAAARVATIRFRPSWVAPAVWGVPLAFLALSSLRAAPHQLAYFNEFVGGPGRGQHILSDSNLDWGQDLKGVKAYVVRHHLPVVYLSYFGMAPPGYYGIRYQYVPTAELAGAPHPGGAATPSHDLFPPGVGREMLFISTVNLQGVYFGDRDLFAWLRGRTPVARIGGSIAVYDLTGDARAHLELARVYLKRDYPNLAALEVQKALAFEPSLPPAGQILGDLKGH